MGGHGKHAGRVRLGIAQKGRPSGVALDLGVFVVVQPGAAHLPVLHGESQGLDQVQGATRVGREANDVPGVGRDLGLDKDDMKHACDCHRAACE